MKTEILKGTVIKFKGDGRVLGYPTANLAVETDLEDGVYFGFADLGEFKHHPALIFVGVPVTMGESARRVEAHLLDIPDKDYYGLVMTLSVEKFYRPNRSLSGMDELVALMQDDEAAARRWFKAN